MRKQFDFKWEREKTCTSPYLVGCWCYPGGRRVVEGGESQWHLCSFLNCVYEWNNYLGWWRVQDQVPWFLSSHPTTTVLFHSVGWKLASHQGGTLWVSPILTVSSLKAFLPVYKSPLYLLVLNSSWDRDGSWVAGFQVFALAYVLSLPGQPQHVVLNDTNYKWGNKCFHTKQLLPAPYLHSK